MKIKLIGYTKKIILNDDETHEVYLEAELEEKERVVECYKKLKNIIDHLDDDEYWKPKEELL